MANFTLTRAAINTSFKSLSIFTVVIAACRLAFQYNADVHRVDYTALTFWLVAEVAIAVIMASISSYRIVVIDHLLDGHAQHDSGTTLLKVRHMLDAWKSGCQKLVAKITKIADPSQRTRLDSLSELSVQQDTHSSASLPRDS